MLNRGGFNILETRGDSTQQNMLTKLAIEETKKKVDLPG